jgi:prevent-host-death family protein
MTVVVNIHAAKTHLSRLVDRAAGGEDIVIARAGKPVARLGPLVDAKRTIRFGLLAGKIRYARGCDAPMTADELRIWYEAPVEPAKKQRRR